MDARRTLTMSGTAAIAVGAVVASVLAVTQAVSLADAAGEPVSAAPVVVPSASTPAVPPADPAPAASSSDVKVVPAPAPRDVAEPADIHDVIARFESDGDVTKVEAWIAVHRDDALTWQRFLGERDHETGRDDRPEGARSPRAAAQTPAAAGHESGTHLPSAQTGSKKERSRFSPDQRD